MLTHRSLGSNGLEIAEVENIESIFVDKDIPQVWEYFREEKYPTLETNVIALKTGGWHDVNFVAAGGHAGCHNDNLRCRQWRQSWHHDNFLVSICTLLSGIFVINYHWLR